MTKSDKADDTTVACEVCMKEIPRSEAKVEEAIDYVTYFCGLECFDKWKQSEKNNKNT